MTAFYETQEWFDLRYRVLRKNNGCCQLCGVRGTEDNPLQVDHIKPRSKYPELEMVEANLQVLCKACNGGKSNKDQTDWRFRASNEALDRLNRRALILRHATSEQTAKLEQLSWLQKNDLDEQIKKEADKQYRSLWSRIEESWILAGNPE